MARLGGADRSARRLVGVVLAVLVASLSLAIAGSAGGETAQPVPTCRAPRLGGLTLEAARRKAKRSGCTLRLKGARLKLPSIQTVELQAPVVGRRAARVTVFLNPLCVGSAAGGSGVSEPTVISGPTELHSGFYVAGGPVMRYSTPACRRPEPKSGEGTVEVFDAKGTLVASATATGGHLALIPLQPGSYTIRGTFGSAEINGAHPTQTDSVVVTAGHTVRQDFTLSVP
jgi:hypothetical protein